MGISAERRRRYDRAGRDESAARRDSEAAERDGRALARDAAATDRDTAADRRDERRLDRIDHLREMLTAALAHRTADVDSAELAAPAGAAGEADEEQAEIDRQTRRSERELADAVVRDVGALRAELDRLHEVQRRDAGRDRAAAAADRAHSQADRAAAGRDRIAADADRQQSAVDEARYL
ncbi:hypothetical protein [Nakamurella endophytica]|uniref:Uncharacterized protein n=1 Tax=Nakamurella endophytica TaxID=1748367 RepID=A0A917WP20_9ACTN|nr:hypothetical protein [Nakamurella endophytica]GGM17752.1 hypothetical protein GCM10011594_42300 [Nakamurella endophytica]